MMMVAHNFLLTKSSLQRAGSGLYAVTMTAGEDAPSKQDTTLLSEMLSIQGLSITPISG
jgi:hypothetical protein